MAEPSLYKSISKTAKEKQKEQASLVRDLEHENHFVMYKNDDKKQKTLGVLKQMFTNADASRPDDDWEVSYLQFISEVLVSDNGQANINLPIEQAVIRNKMADINAMKTIINFVPTTDDDIHKLQMNKVLWDFCAMESDLEYQTIKHKLQSLVFGSSPWFEGLKKEVSTRYEPTIDENGKINGEIKTVEESFIEGHPLDIRDVWFDPVPDWKDAQYVFHLERGLLREDIEALKDDPSFDAEAIDCMLQGIPMRNRGENPSGSMTFITNEEIMDSTKLKYNLYHFYHKKKGLYIVVDDTFSYIIREGVSPFPHRQLPITMLVDHRQLFSMYGFGEPRLLRSTKYERNEIRNQILDGVRLGNTMNLMVGETVSFEGNETVGGIMNVWHTKGNSNDAKFLQSPQMNSTIFNVDTMLQADATWITSIDVNSLVGQSADTAFQAGLQEQTKAKVIAEYVRNYDFWYRDMARQRMANIQFFMPTTTGRNILGEDTDPEKYRTIAIQNKKMSDSNGLNKKGELVKKGVKFEDEEGVATFFELTPDEIANNCDVSVETPTTTPLMKYVQQKEASDLINTILMMVQTPEGAQALSKVNFDKLLRKEFKDKGYDPEEFIESEDEGVDKRKLKESIMSQFPKPPKIDQPTSPSPIDAMMAQVQNPQITQSPTTK